MDTEFRAVSMFLKDIFESTKIVYIFFISSITSLLDFLYDLCRGGLYIYTERGVLNQLGNLLQLISGGPPIHMDIIPVRRLI